MFVGRHVPYKGIHVVINAFKKIDKNLNIKLNIIGDGPLTNDLKSLAKDDYRIKFSGEINDQQLKLEYCNAHVFVLPSVSRAEAFGIVQVEAMLHSCLCLSSFLDNGVNIVNKDRLSGRSFPPNNSDKLSELLLCFLRDNELRNQYMKSANKYAVETFSSKTLQNEYKNLYLK